MNPNGEHDPLRARFLELREDDARHAPSFAGVWQAARTRTSVTKVRWQPAFAACVLALTVVVGFALKAAPSLPSSVPAAADATPVVGQVATPTPPVSSEEPPLPVRAPDQSVAVTSARPPRDRKAPPKPGRKTRPSVTNTCEDC